MLRFLRRLCVRRRIYALGDSHVAVIHHDLFKFAFPLTDIVVTCLHGATVSGLENPNSKTQARKRFEIAINKAPEGSTILLMLGEVDTGFVIWYRAKKYGESIDQMMNLAVDNYLRLIKQVGERHRPVVISAPLPTIVDNCPIGKVANQRKEISATQKERTALTMRFNTIVESRCRTLSATYINCDQSSVGPHGLVRDELRHPDPANHHYKPSAHARLLIPRLRRIL